MTDLIRIRESLYESTRTVQEVYANRKTYTIRHQEGEDIYGV